MSKSEPKIEKGSKIFTTNCGQCHNVKKGGSIGQGHNLFNIVGRVAGTVAEFQYSSANQNSGLTWYKKTLNKYMINPKKMMTGTKMVFAGLKKKRDRRESLALLAS
eukprot:749240_1